MRKVLFVLFASLLALSAAAQLPSVQLRDIEGRTVDTATLSNDGRPIIISFWATWCKPCQRELKAIAEVYDEWQEETGVRLVAVSTDEGQNVAKVRPLVDAEGWEYQVLLDSNGDFMRTLGVQTIPHALIVDGQGNIVWQHTGYTEGGEQEIIDVVRKLVNQ